MTDRDPTDFNRLVDAFEAGEQHRYQLGHIAAGRWEVEALSWEDAADYAKAHALPKCEALDVADRLESYARSMGLPDDDPAFTEGATIRALVAENEALRDELAKNQGEAK